MKITCQKVTQNNVEFYLGKIKFEDLSKISAVSHRIIMGFDEQQRPIYNNSFQRKVNSTRKNAIKNYILIDEEAAFPNSIILSVPAILLKKEIGDQEFTEIEIDDSVVVLIGESPIYVQIIDGQHRLAGLKARSEEGREGKERRNRH